jgi:enamine deaminase RidA (YjgF/YER057c/UK114 family)
MTPSKRLTERGFELPPAPKPKGSYASTATSAGLVFVSGHTGRTATRPALTGIVGTDVDLDAARDSAVQAALNVLGALDEAAGLDHVVRTVRLRAYIRASQHFTDHGAVIDPASDLLSHVFPDGGHARSAIGVASLPGGAAVELEAVFALGGDLGA